MLVVNLGNFDIKPFNVEIIEVVSNVVVRVCINHSSFPDNSVNVLLPTSPSSFKPLISTTKSYEAYFILIHCDLDGVISHWG